MRTHLFTDLHVYASCVLVCLRICTDIPKIFVAVQVILINISLKFHKDLSFRCGDFCKIKIKRLQEMSSVTKNNRIIPIIHKVDNNQVSDTDNILL